MKKLLIIYPNWVPSNAVGVQRVRLMVNYLQDFGWDPIILAVKPEFYEEEISPDLVNIVKPGIKVEYVNAKKAGKRFRLYGDIALRAFGNLKKRAIEIVNEQQVDCIWVPIPPFYTALIGRQVHEATGKPYVIDYIDPWVHDFPGSKKLFSRSRLATLISRFLEPIAVKKVAALTGVSEAYFLPVIERNSQLKNIPYCGMPYGFDPGDYKVKPNNLKLLWDGEANAIPYVYAGAFLPNAHFYIDTLFKVIARMRKSKTLNKNVRFYFVGTGYTSLRSITDYAVMHGISDIVSENKGRISYLEVLNNLSGAAGVLAIGSTEAHYTASKIFQSVLSERPVFAVFHHQSTVVQILGDANADNYLVQYNEQEQNGNFENEVFECFDTFLNLRAGWNPQIHKLDQYSARNSARALADIVNSTLN